MSQEHALDLKLIIDPPPPQGKDAGLSAEPLEQFGLDGIDFSHFTHREMDIFRAVAVRRPNTEFPLFMEQVMKESLNMNIGDQAFETMNPLHRYIQDLMRRWYAKLDHTYDSCMTEFDRKELDPSQFMQKILSTVINVPAEFGGTTFSLGEITELFYKIIHDQHMYTNEEERKLLERDYRLLMSYSINTSFNLVAQEVNSDPLRVKAAKLGIHSFHGAIMFDSGAVSYVRHDNYHAAKSVYIRSKMAHQVKNDFLGIPEDLRDGAANLFLGIAQEQGEKVGLLNDMFFLSQEVVNDQLAYSRHLAELIPKTYLQLRNLQQNLLLPTKISERLTQICLIPYYTD